MDTQTNPTTNDNGAAAPAPTPQRKSDSQYVHGIKRGRFCASIFAAPGEHGFYFYAKVEQPIKPANAGGETVWSNRFYASEADAKARLTVLAGDWMEANKKNAQELYYNAQARANAKAAA